MKKVFTVATWNLGHFSMGKHRNSDFGDDAYETEAAKFRAYIDSLGADLLSLNEYSACFTPSHPARELTRDFTTCFEGEQYRYSCNALFSKLPLRKFVQNEFVCNRTAVISHTKAIEASDYYYITAELSLGDETVTVVSTHLGFDDNLYPDTVNLAQMDELIARFKDEKRILMMGDWNAFHYEYFDRFGDAGYSLGNPEGKILTCIGSRTGRLEWPVDNILVKGLSLSDFRALPTSLSDHVAVKATIALE